MSPDGYGFRSQFYGVNGFTWSRDRLTLPKSLFQKQSGFVGKVLIRNGSCLSISLASTRDSEISLTPMVRAPEQINPMSRRRSLYLRLFLASTILTVVG